MNIKLQEVYKLVQVRRGIMYSVNPFLEHFEMYRKNGKLLIYKLGFQVVPDKKAAPALFVVPSLQEAEIAVKTYSSPHLRILKGLAANVREINDKRIDPAFKRAVWEIPESFKSCVCDWFIPLEITKNYER